MSLVGERKRFRLSRSRFKLRLSAGSLCRDYRAQVEKGQESPLNIEIRGMAAWWGGGAGGFQQRYRSVPPMPTRV